MVREAALKKEKKYKEENSIGNFVCPDKPAMTKLLEDIGDETQKNKGK